MTSKQKVTWGIIFFGHAATWLSLMLVPTSARADDAAPPIRQATTPDGVKYGIWGEPKDEPAPTLIMLAGTIQSTLENPYFRQSGNELAPLGYLVVSLDIPCHGELAPAGKPSGLGGWSTRVGNDDDFVAESNQRMSSMVDDLIKTGVTDPKRIAAGGTSRGGYLALQFAAHDPRVKCVAAFAPVTDLAALSEFSERKEHPLTIKLNLTQQAEKLAGRPVWVVIGDRDARVDTDSVVEFARRLGAVAVERDVASQVDLHVISEPRGHTTPKGSSRFAADWIHGHISTPNPAN